MPAFLLKLIGLPRWAHYAIGAAALVLAFSVWLWSHDRAVIAEHETEIAEAVAAKTEAGEAAAKQASGDVKSETERTNEQARDAANGSDDPMRDAFGRLRSAR